MERDDRTREAWVAIAPPRATEGPRRPGYDFGYVPAMGRLLAAHPEIGPPFARLFGQVMFGPGALDRSEREMVAAVAAAAQDCFY